jgi:hypothetical protein
LKNWENRRKSAQHALYELQTVVSPSARTLKITQQLRHAHARPAQTPIYTALSEGDDEHDIRKRWPARLSGSYLIFLSEPAYQPPRLI